MYPGKFGKAGAPGSCVRGSCFTTGLCGGEVCSICELGGIFRGTGGTEGIEMDTGGKSLNPEVLGP